MDDLLLWFNLAPDGTRQFAEKSAVGVIARSPADAGRRSNLILIAGDCLAARAMTR
jgi:hypothetical protein